MRFRFAGFSVELKPGTLTANRVLSLPDIGGTLAVTSQLKRTSLLVTATRNLVATDAQLHLYNSGTSLYTLTIPVSTFAADMEIELTCPGTGSFSILPASGFTLNGGTASIAVSAGKGAYIKFYAPNTAWMYGGS